MKRRIICLILLVMISIFSITACGTKNDESSREDITSSDEKDPATKDTVTNSLDDRPTDKYDEKADDISTSETYPTYEEPSDAKKDTFISDIITTTDTALESKAYREGSDEDWVTDEYGSELLTDEFAPEFTSDIMLPISPDPMDPKYPYNITAGLLTAGEWSDNNNWTFFTNLIANQQLNLPSFGMNPINRIMVTVLGEDGEPIKNAGVNLLSETGEVIWEAVSDYNGNSYVFFNVLNNNQTPGSLSITKGGVSTSAEIIMESVIDEQNSNNPPKYQSYQDVTVTIEDTPSTKALDIMFAFDTTGSMVDELSYLQAEFEDISKKVADQNTRFSFNFYRDEGDVYVVNSNAFTYDIDLVLNQLNKEYADGGGDYPEAVDQALYDGVFNHNWNFESVKLLFLILDAPPHSQNPQIDENLQRTIIEAAKQGIRIIPVASSGVDKETETFLRTTAILTGGTYTFLTDDSGIGGSHIEPTIGNYQVENLNDCIVRIIKTYYQ